MSNMIFHVRSGASLLIWAIVLFFLLKNPPRVDTKVIIYMLTALLVRP